MFFDVSQAVGHFLQIEDTTFVDEFLGECGIVGKHFDASVCGLLTYDACGLKWT